MIEVYTDGGARGNPGPAAIGFVIIKDNKIVYKHGEFIGKTTNNVAEYTAVLKSMEWLIKNHSSIIHHPSSINFYLDSQLVVQQLSGNWKIKNPDLKKLILKIKSYEIKMPSKINYIQIKRNHNFQADSLVNLALDKVLN